MYRVCIHGHQTIRTSLCIDEGGGGVFSRGGSAHSSPVNVDFSLFCFIFKVNLPFDGHGCRFGQQGLA
jgi:hypothetical protein